LGGLKISVDLVIGSLILGLVIFEGLANGAVLGGASFDFNDIDHGGLVLSNYKNGSFNGLGLWTKAIEVFTLMMPYALWPQN